MAPAPVAPPTPQEIQRKLSVHSVSRPKNANLSLGPVSGTESDSDSIFTPDVGTPTTVPHGFYFGTSPSQPPLSAIAEGKSDSGDDTEYEIEAGEEGWNPGDVRGRITNPAADESVLKAGYLWKKGKRRKTWKKRWFVLRPAHLAYYKTSKEYQLLRLLELTDVHSCTLVNLKRHDHTFGLICSSRTYYLQASDAQGVQEWVKAIEAARQSLLATSTQSSVATATAITTVTATRSVPPETPLSNSTPQQTPRRLPAFTSSDSDSGLNPQQERAVTISSTQAPRTSPVSKPSQKDPTKVILSGYLMKCGSKRRNWRKRWFVLTGEKLIYHGSHMDPKPHRSFAFNEILDALEYDLQTHKQTSGPSASPSQGTDGDDVSGTHTFKIVTTQKTLLLCAPSEDDEIKWLGAIRALIARRTESGQVPGKVSKVRPPENGKEAEGSGGGGSSGLKTKVKRLSGTGAHHDDHTEWKGIS